MPADRKCEACGGTGLASGRFIWSAEALAGILKQRRDGARLSAIARDLGVSNLRVTQLLNKALRLEQDPENPFNSLGSRARSILLANGLDSVSSVRAAFADGSILDVPGLGLAGLRGIRDWLRNCE